MNLRNLPLIALIALPAASMAQSSVVLYGIADAGLVRESGGAAGTQTKITSGIGSASRFGLRGSEDLGGGLSAELVLESGIRLDSGEPDAANTIFNRQAYVGLKSASAGALTLGRQYTPYYLTVANVADPFGGGYAGNAKNLFPTAGANTRTSNTVVYTSPTASGFSGELAYALGEQPDSNSAGRQFGAAIGYVNGALVARIAYNNRNSDVSAAAGAPVSLPIGTNTIVAANYDFGVLRAYAAYSRDKGSNSAPLPNASNPYGGVKPTASLDGAEYLVGFTVPALGGTVMASYISKDDKTAFNQDATQLGVGYSHPMSKRTSLYVAYARIHNRRGAGYTVGNNSEAGSGDRAFNLGMRHTF